MAGKKKEQMGPEEAKQWYESLTPEQVEKEAQVLLCRAAIARLDREEVLKLHLIPLTPERIQYFESELKKWLEAESWEEDKRSRSGRDLYPDSNRIGKSLFDVDQVLNPETWRPVLRSWAKRFKDEITASAGSPGSYGENIPWDALAHYLAEIENAERWKPRRFGYMTPAEAQAWYESLCQEEIQKMSVALLGWAAQGWHRLDRVMVRQLAVIPPTPERVEFFESKLNESLESDCRHCRTHFQFEMKLIEAGIGIVGPDAKEDATATDASQEKTGPAGGPPIRLDIQLDPKTWREDVKTQAGHLTKLDRRLAPATWQPVLRNWAKRRMDEISGCDRIQFWQRLAREVLERYLRSIGQKDQPANSPCNGTP